MPALCGKLLRFSWSSQVQNQAVEAAERQLLGRDQSVAVAVPAGELAVAVADEVAVDGSAGKLAVGDALAMVVPACSFQPFARSRTAAGDAVALAAAAEADLAACAEDEHLVHAAGSCWDSYRAHLLLDAEKPYDAKRYASRHNAVSCYLEKKTCNTRVPLPGHPCIFVLRSRSHASSFLL